MGIAPDATVQVGGEVNVVEQIGGDIAADGVAIEPPVEGEQHR